MDDSEKSKERLISELKRLREQNSKQLKQYTESLLAMSAMFKNTADVQVESLEKFGEKILALAGANTETSDVPVEDPVPAGPPKKQSKDIGKVEIRITKTKKFGLMGAEDAFLILFLTHVRKVEGPDSRFAPKERNAEDRMQNFSFDPKKDRFTDIVKEYCDQYDDPKYIFENLDIDFGNFREQNISVAEAKEYFGGIREPIYG